jgi:hypothetical protein
MAHKVRIELPPEIRESIETAVRTALEACPEEDGWDVAILESAAVPGQWDAVAAGPRVEPGGAWEMLSATGRWLRKPEALYVRQFEGAMEQHPSYVHQSFHELFRCFERT